MNLQKLAWVFAIVFLLIGILGFVPGITTGDGMLLGIFMVDSAHNIVHLLSGIVAALTASASAKAARSYFQIFGIVYGLVTVWGFFASPVLGFLNVNGGDNGLHLIIAVIALWAGFGMKDGARSAA